MTDTGEIIKMCRKSLNWSRPKLSRAAGILLDTVINVERHNNCKFSTFEKLIEAMGYEIEILRKE
jgi:hypothetical protein